MSRKKTHQGVELRSTFGMNRKQENKTWVVIMDRTQGKVYEWSAQGQTLNSIKTWKFPMGKAKGSDLISDRPGRVFDSKTFARGGHQTAMPRHSYSNKEKPQRHLAVVSCKKVVDWVEKGRKREGNLDLVFVAEPKLMGTLKNQFSKKSQEKIVKRWEKDFHWLSEIQVKERLIQWLSGRSKFKLRMMPPKIGAFGYITPSESAHGA